MIPSHHNEASASQVLRGLSLRDRVHLTLHACADAATRSGFNNLKYRITKLQNAATLWHFHCRAVQVCAAG